MIIKYIPNPLDKSTIEHVDVVYAALPLMELTEIYLEIDTKYHLAIVNGTPVSWDFIPAADDDIIITVDISGGTNGIIGGLMAAVGAVVGVVTGWTGIGGAVATGLISAGNKEYLQRI